VGEVACTGLHGANRLASNSLLEAVVFAHQAYAHGLIAAQKYCETRKDDIKTKPAAPLPAWDTGRAVRLEEQIDIAATWFEIRSLMWNYVGIVRSDRRLGRALRRLDTLKQEIQRDYWDYLLTRDLIELRNLVTVAELIVKCALARKESRGLHFTVDYPEKDDVHFLKDTVL
jgi:L-aspartate oxidase